MGVLTMTKRRSFLRGIGALGTGVGFNILRGGAAEAADTSLVILVAVARSNALGNISRAELRRLFLRDANSIGQQTFIPFNAPHGSPERVLFDRIALGMSPDEAARFWLDRRIRGQTGAPRVAPTGSLRMQLAARFPGAIVYLTQSALTAEVKALTIDGKTTGEPGYLLRSPKQG